MAENKKYQHPEGKIQLLNGTILDCYPLEQPQDKVDNQLILDTTGLYLSVGKKPVSSVVEADEREELDRKAFLENAFLFIENRERILSDSRMFLCHIPIQSGLAYTGTSGFNRPTLGIYLEWWRHCANANILEKDGKKWLVYRLAGSPLSGSNRCGVVNRKGETKTQQIGNFKSLWTTFQKINCRYDEAKSKYQAYSLREVLDIFQKEGRTVVYKKDMYIYFLEQENKKLRTEVENRKSYAQYLYDKLHGNLLIFRRSNLEAFYTEYLEKEKKVNVRVDNLKSERLLLHIQLREGRIDNIQYQKQWSPLHKEMAAIQIELKRFADDALREMFPEMSISLSDVRDFFNN